MTGSLSIVEQTDLEMFTPVTSTSALLGDDETFLPKPWASVQAGGGVGLFVNLSPTRNFLLNRHFFLTASYMFRTQSSQPPSKYAFHSAQVGGWKGTDP